MPDKPEDRESEPQPSPEREAEDPAEGKRRKNREWHEAFVEANKERFVLDAFSDAFVDILRDVSRTQSYGTPGVVALSRFIEMLDRGPNVTLGDLSRAALRRVKPEWTVEVSLSHEGPLLAVARAGLAYLIDHQATDGFAGARKSRWADELRRAIEDYNDERERRRKAAQAKFAPTERPASTGRKSRQRTMATAKQRSQPGRPTPRKGE